MTAPKVQKTTPSNPRDRRQFPRIATVLPVVIKTRWGKTINAHMFNISPGGLQIRCGKRTAEKIRKEAIESSSKKSMSVVTHFLLPLHSGRELVIAKCRVKHVSIVKGAAPEAEVALGLEFSRFKSVKYLKRFVRYIEEQLVPLEDYALYCEGAQRSARASARKKTRPRPPKAAAAGG